MWCCNIIIIFFKFILMNNTNITYNNSIAITTYTINIANDTDITYNTIDTYNKYYSYIPLH